MCWIECTMLTEHAQSTVKLWLNHSWAKVEAADRARICADTANLKLADCLDKSGAKAHYRGPLSG